MSRAWTKVDLLTRLADRTIGGNPDEPHNDTGIGPNIWQWHQGVALYGLVKAYETTNKAKYKEFIRSWVDGHLERRDFGKSINTTAPLLAVLKLYEWTGEQKYYDLCEEFADWCMAEAPRAEEGTFEHSCTANSYPNQIWADTLFMGCLFLTQWSRVTKRRVYAREAVRQFALHYKYLHDPATGLLYHGYYGNERQKRGVIWGRGNGWYAAAFPEVISLLDSEEPLRETLIADFKRFIKGVAEAQDTSGAWHTVMNAPHTYLELSATAAFTYGLGQAIERGYLDRAYVTQYDRGINALIRHINEQGELTSASGGTSVMPNLEDYNAVKYAPTYFAQGLAMIALSAV
ncbi:glycoside hydrolase family 88/105 protein [Paenibacillus cremeus]|uniref:Glycoside hydrolase family 88 protein n=1 Tax=Paenibacillus cremeus TaxID=2163881 RepID=A0A559K6M3_9BACL|nr:glycoside hydrolase family 88 protein [Paenibacillus cremeus]TVY07779.1 glycoside hydrolase family 88 protein [Paenibacillus cremeus]